VCNQLRREQASKVTTTHQPRTKPQTRAQGCGAEHHTRAQRCGGGHQIETMIQTHFFDHCFYLSCCHPHLLELHLHDGRRRRGLRDGLFAFFDAGKTPDGISLSRIGNAQHATHLPLNAAHLARNVYASAPVSAVHAK
jgi:hypothetical protein